MLARDLMTTPVFTITPDATVGEAAQVMLERTISCLPVMDEQEHLVGILTHTDFGLHPRYRHQAENIYSLLGAATTPQHIEQVSRTVSSKRVREVMRHPVITVREDTSLGEVIELMLHREIHRLPVLRGSRLAGIITNHDFLKLIASGKQAGEGI